MQAVAKTEFIAYNPAIIEAPLDWAGAKVNPSVIDKDPYGYLETAMYTNARDGFVLVFDHHLWKFYFVRIDASLLQRIADGLTYRYGKSDAKHGKPILSGGTFTAPQNGHRVAILVQGTFAEWIASQQTALVREFNPNFNSLSIVGDAITPATVAQTLKLKEERILAWPQFYLIQVQTINNLLRSETADHAEKSQAEKPYQTIALYDEEAKLYYCVLLDETLAQAVKFAQPTDRPTIFSLPIAGSKFSYFFDLDSTDCLTWSKIHYQEACDNKFIERFETLRKKFDKTAPDVGILYLIEEYDTMGALPREMFLTCIFTEILPYIEGKVFLKTPDLTLQYFRALYNVEETMSAAWCKILMEKLQ